jgi:hypothetical protein
MFGRKPKQSTPASDPMRRQVQRGNAPQAFSYYSSRAYTPSERRAKPQSPKNQQDEKKQKRKFSMPMLLSGLPFWLLMVVVCVCLVKVLLLSDSPKIVVVGNSDVSDYMRADAVYAAAAQKLLDSSVTNRCKLTVNANGVTQALKREFPELQDVSVSIPLVSNRPVVYIQPASQSLVLQSTSGNYSINDTGFVLSKLVILPEGAPTVVDQSGLIPIPGKQLLPSGTVTFTETVAYQFKAAHLSISTFVLPSGSPYELDVRLEGQPYMIRFNLESSPLVQSGAAIATIQQLGSTKPSSYIDVRVAGRVYYK